MTRSARSTLRTLAIAAVLGFAPLPAPAADRGPGDAAAQQVERGANQIGQGVMEGAKYTGPRLGEAGKAAAPEAKTAWERTKEGEVAFGSSVREFVGSLFR